MRCGSNAAVGRIGRDILAETERLEHALDSLRVVSVHLAAERGDVVAPHSLGIVGGPRSAAGAHYKMSQDKMEQLLRAAGYEPRQRTNLYERFVTREETAELARKYRHALTAQNRAFASPLTVVG